MYGHQVEHKRAKKQTNDILKGSLLYKHQWNTKWAFPRKLHIFKREDNMLYSRWRDHRRYCYIINRVFELIWYFTGVCITNRIWHTRLWIWILSSRLQLDISLVRSLVRYWVDHSKTKLMSTRGYVISSMSHKLFFLQSSITAMSKAAILRVISH